VFAPATFVRWLAAEAFNAVVQISTPDCSATGFVFERYGWRLIMTNYHVLPSIEIAKRSQAIFYNEDWVASNVVPVPLQPTLHCSHPTLDYCVVAYMMLPELANVVPLPLSSAMPSVDCIFHIVQHLWVRKALSFSTC
jgi:hypothetical protein